MKYEVGDLLEHIRGVLADNTPDINIIISSKPSTSGGWSYEVQSLKYNTRDVWSSHFLHNSNFWRLIE